MRGGQRHGNSARVSHLGLRRILTLAQPGQVRRQRSWARDLRANRRAARWPYLGRIRTRQGGPLLFYCTKLTGEHMSQPLCVLIVEDSEDDAMLLLMSLRKAGFVPQWKRVDTKDGLNAALDERP